jgi:DNA-binding CsgD family transcriptional regulator
MSISKKLESLTPREQAILDELIQGKTNQEISDTLGITLRTVEEHMRRIFLKTGARSRLSLVVDIYESLINGKLRKGRTK